MNDLEHALERAQQEIDALEIELELVWCSLDQVPVPLWLTPAGRILRPHQNEPVLGAKYIGRYTEKVKLEDFRSDVFFIFEEIHGRHHG